MLTPQKCDFCMEKVVFLGFVVSSRGIEMDAEKVKTIKDWQVPTSASEVHRFHDLASCYRRFVKNFSTIATPLTEVVKKDVGFVWGETYNLACHKLKDKLGTAPLLVLPDFSKTFKIACDASGVGIGWYRCYINAGKMSNCLFQ